METMRKKMPQNPRNQNCPSQILEMFFSTITFKISIAFTYFRSYFLAVIRQCKDNLLHSFLPSL